MFLTFLYFNQLPISHYISYIRVHICTNIFIDIIYDLEEFAKSIPNFKPTCIVINMNW